VEFKEAQHCLQDSKWITGILFWYKKTVIPKKKVIDGRDLEDCLPNLNLPLKRGKEKKKIKFFYHTTILCFPEE
jgi:hypothetical protein